MHQMGTLLMLWSLGALAHGLYGKMPSMGWEEVVGTGNGQEIRGTAAAQQLGGQRSSGASRTGQLSQTTL